MSLHWRVVSGLRCRRCDGLSGALPPHEWALRSRELINDDAMRAEMGAKAKELAAQWTLQRGWQEWEAAYKTAL